MGEYKALCGEIVAAWKTVRTPLRLNIKKEENVKKEDEKSRDIRVQNFESHGEEFGCYLKNNGQI